VIEPGRDPRAVSRAEMHPLDAALGPRGAALRPAAGRIARPLLTLLLVSTAALLGGAAADWRTPPRGEGPETAPVRRIEGEPYIAVNDLARLLDATKFWRADVRQLVLRTGAHSLVLTAENPFVVVDEATVYLPAPVRSQAGELQVPVALVAMLPADSSLTRLFHDPRRQLVIVLPPSGGVGSPRFAVAGAVTRVMFPADRAEEAVVVARSRDHLRLRFGGIFTGGLPDSAPPGSLVLGIRSIPSAGGSAFELRVATEAAGFRLVQDPGGRRVVLEVARQADATLEAFAPEGPAGPRTLRVVVLDPGHGGADAGVRAPGAMEKDLALALARSIQDELQRVLAARIVLTRTDDRDLSAEERAEIANRLHADLVLSLHFDGFVSPRARGATGYCPLATFASGASAATAETRPGEPTPGAVVVLPWRDVGSRHAVQSRALAEAILSALELRGQGPTRLRERLPHALLGVNAPGVLLECATLTAGSDRERVVQEEGLRQLAASIAEGVVAYQRNP
jgi:N-acetylmuramoyl-L-alanine amidase